MRATMSEDGLRTRRRGLVPWDQVFAVRYRRRGGLVYTAAGVFLVDLATAQRVEQRIAPWEAERSAWAESLSPAQRAEWLGIGTGDSIELKANRTGLVVLGAVFGAMLVAMLLVAAATRSHAFLLILMTFTAALVASIGLAASWSVSNWTVDARGITSRGRLVRWSALRSYHSFYTPMAPMATSMTVDTTDGTRSITNQSAEAQAVHRALLRWESERSLAVPMPAGRGRLYPSTLGRRALYVGDDGLWRLWRGGAECVPWSEVRGVRWLGHSAEIVLAGDRRLPLLRFVGANALAEAIDQRLAGGESVVDAEGQLRGEVIERWLGVPAGGAVQCRLSSWVSIGLPVVLLMMFMGLFAAAGKGGGGVAGQIPQIILMLVFVAGSARAVQADAQGLSIRRRGRREYYAWSEIEGLKPESYGTVINTTRGPIKLSSMAKNQGLIIGIINRILTARAGGASLPDRAPLPETALSRMTGAEPPVVGDRGLSISASDD